MVIWASRNAMNRQGLRLISGAGDGVRTRDILLGRQVLCQTELLPRNFC